MVAVGLCWAETSLKEEGLGGGCGGEGRGWVRHKRGFGKAEDKSKALALPCFSRIYDV